MKFFLLMATLLLVSPLYAAEIEGPDRVDPYSLVEFTIDLNEGDSAIWEAFRVGPDLVEADGETVEGGRRYLFTGPPGEYRVTSTSLIKGSLSQSRKYTTIGELEPEPEPQPPGPTPPDPVVPDPPAPVTDSLLGGEGFRVLVIRETADPLPPEQERIFTSTDVRDYLQSRVARDGRLPAYRFWDDDYSREQVAGHATFADAYPKVVSAAKSLPWIVAENGNKRVSQPLPANVDETLSLLKSVAE